jgi:hypothetical protein
MLIDPPANETFSTRSNVSGTPARVSLVVAYSAFITHVHNQHPKYAEALRIYNEIGG